MGRRRRRRAHDEFLLEAKQRARLVVVGTAEERGELPAEIGGRVHGGGERRGASAD